MKGMQLDKGGIAKYLLLLNKYIIIYMSQVLAGAFFPWASNLWVERCEKNFPNVCHDLEKVLVRPMSNNGIKRGGFFNGREKNIR